MQGAERCVCSQTAVSKPGLLSCVEALDRGVAELEKLWWSERRAARPCNPTRLPHHATVEALRWHETWYEATQVDQLLAVQQRYYPGNMSSTAGVSMIGISHFKQTCGGNNGQLYHIHGAAKLHHQLKGTP